MPSFPARLPLFVAASGLALSAMPLLPVAAAGSFAWTQRSTTSAPWARFAHDLLSDAARGSVVLFGGFDEVFGNFQLENDTWTWDGTTWTQLQPLTSPAARQYYAMAYDAARGRVVLFGGATQLNGGGIAQDTWEFDGTTWAQA